MDIKILTGLLFTGLITAGTAQATTVPQDVPAVLAISGVVSSSDRGCRVALSKENLFFTMNAGEVIYQGDNATQPQIVTVTIQDNEANSSYCTKAVEAGQIAVRFVGQADNADGTSLANQYDKAEYAAKGVGIGFFKEDNSPVAINSGSLKVSDVGSATNMGSVKFGVQPVRLNNQQITAGMVTASATVEIERL
ncbi:fimbrial protein [Cronobacter turicensis]|uniref:fimbrial protein n=1 Tax=Cronobacter turicensis TaxID=413502 RepID=UPI0014124625|nr:fimbrial protein [Cronobacter turicensis]NHV10872.1 fimbrial protein [Cronobacter turicensis]NHV64900.1 fimbrial protein [Cronobacter turicensis]NHW11841.1 fimbrial protein [Cronobacter turicensis]